MRLTVISSFLSSLWLQEHASWAAYSHVSAMQPILSSRGLWIRIPFIKELSIFQTKKCRGVRLSVIEAWKRYSSYLCYVEDAARSLLFKLLFICSYLFYSTTDIIIISPSSGGYLLFKLRNLRVLKSSGTVIGRLVTCSCHYYVGPLEELRKMIPLRGANSRNPLLGRFHVKAKRR